MVKGRRAGVELGEVFARAAQRFLNSQERAGSSAAWGWQRHRAGERDAVAQELHGR